MTVLRICVSYEATGTAFATQLLTDLRNAGAEVVTERVGASLAPTDGRFLSEELPQCQYLIVVQTPEALQSPRVQTIVDTALKYVQAGQMAEVLRVITPTLNAVQAQEVPPLWAMTPEFDVGQDYPRALARLCLHLGIGTNPVHAAPPLPDSSIPPLGLPDSRETEKKSSIAGLFHPQRSDVDRPRRPYRYSRVLLRSRFILFSLAMVLVLVIAGVAFFIHQSSTPDGSVSSTSKSLVVVHSPTPTSMSQQPTSAPTLIPTPMAQQPTPTPIPTLTPTVQQPTPTSITGPTLTTGSTPTTGPTPTPTSVPAQKIYAEQEGHNGANTFTNPDNASGMGPNKIPAAAWVQVSCKVYAPAIQSANPDGYWYRIASSPWNNDYYAVANTFMNGDPWGGPYTHNTDFNVPDC
jgi:hypothetical protein